MTSGFSGSGTCIHPTGEGCIAKELQVRTQAGVGRAVLKEGDTRGPMLRGAVLFFFGAPWKCRLSCSQEPGAGAGDCLWFLGSGCDAGAVG